MPRAPAAWLQVGPRAEEWGGALTFESTRTSQVILYSGGIAMISRRKFASALGARALKVSAVVYVAARAPDVGEDYTALAKKFPTPPASAGIVFDGDEGSLTESAFLRDFAGDLPEARARVLYAVQQPFHKALLTGKTKQAAWRSKPSFYAVSTEDRTINPDLERFMAKRMRATTIEVKASHVSLISHPQEIAA